MALVRWEPARDISDVNRLFRSFFDTPTTAAPALRRWVPAMDVAETEDAFVLRADLPGLDASDVEIEVRDRVLTISGERNAEHEDKREGYYRVERSFGRFQRSLTLPEGVEAEQVAATFDKGVLEVRVPKPEARRPHRVAIEAK
jgi:HSP20 family protein